MAIFGNKKKSVIERLDELLNEIDGLPEEEQEKVWAHFDQATDGAADKSSNDGGDADDKSDTAQRDGKESTTEQIESAAEHIAEKGADEQSVKDRIDESVAAQERAEGDEDEQSAKDRVDEAIGEDEHLAEEAEEKAAEPAYDPRPDIAAIREELKNLKELVVKSQQNPEPVKSDEMKSKLDDAAAIYLN